MSAPTDERMASWPEQGSYVRLVQAPAEWLRPFLNWRFQVVRRQRLIWHVRLRADYIHTAGGPTMELSLDAWAHRDWQRYFVRLHD